MKKMIEPPNMKYAFIKAFFTTKKSNANLNEFLSENGTHVDNIYLPVQRHTDRVIIIKKNVGPEIADAVVTDRKGIVIGIQAADCVPILLYDRKNLVVGAVHAGWRGTAAQILKKTIALMSEHFCSLPDKIMVAIGPSIRGCCYPVDYEVKDAVCCATGEGKYYMQKDGKYYVDLSSANALQAMSLGISRENIWISHECTCCNPEKFHSYRYHKDHAGRQGGYIGIF